jgi:anti-sigma-K factor RskA
MNLSQYPEILDRLSAAYALGTLRGRARRRFAAYARQSAVIRASVLLWQERVNTWPELIAPQTPSEDLWPGIRARLHGGFEAQATNRLNPQTAANEAIFSWKTWGGMAAAIFLSVTSTVLWQKINPPAHQQYLAVLSDDRSQASLLVTLDVGQKKLNLKKIGSQEVDSHRSLQLWAIAPGATPQSMGLLDARTAVQIPADARSFQLMTYSSALAVSLEPLGGAPHGSGPTGPVLYKGTVVNNL